MPIFKRQELPALLKGLDEGRTAPVYLVVGDRFLCQQASGEIINHLLPDEKQRAASLALVDGDQEEPGQTLNQIRTYSLFGGRRVIKVSDTRLLFSKVVGKTLWDKALQYRDKNDPRAAGRCLRQFLELESLAVAELLELPEASWTTQLGFSRPPGDLAWVVELLGSGPGGAGGQGGGDMAELYLAALQDGLPGGNILILTAEAADKRKKLYKAIAELGVIVDLTVDSGSGKAAESGRKEVIAEIVRSTLAEFGKKIEPRALELLLERVGFHPVAARLESEKLALFLAELPTATLADVDGIVGRTRDEAIFELNEAVASRDLGTALAIAGRLREGGTHPLAIIAALRNHLRKMLTIRSMQELDSPSYSPGLGYQAFQAGYLERLKKSRPDWPKDLPGHPYALYMLFAKTEKFTLAGLTAGLETLLDAEYSLKSTGLSEKLVLDYLLVRLLRGSTGG
jgi:DNA polymerase-3 subunit delta